MTAQNSIQTCSRTVRRILRDSQQLLDFFTDQRQLSLFLSFYYHIRRQAWSYPSRRRAGRTHSRQAGGARTPIRTPRSGGRGAVAERRPTRLEPDNQS